MQQFLSAIVMAFIVFGYSVVQWRRAGRLLLYLVIFEGALRKWIFPGMSNQIYFAKDAVLVGAFIGMMMGRKMLNRVLSNGMILMLAVFGIYSIIDAFNPSMGSVLVGIMGVKAYLLWALYPILLGGLFKTTEDLYRYMRNVFLVTIPICALAMVQFTLPPDHFLNVYARGEISDINTFGVDSGNVRVTGTFPFLTGFGYYLVFVMVFLLPTTITLESKFTRRLQIILLPMIMISGFMTGSRTTVFAIWLLVIVSLAGLIIFVHIPVEKLRWFFLGVVACILASTFQFEDSWKAWSSRLMDNQEGTDTVSGRILAPLIQVIDPEVFSLIGDGTGSTNNAATAVGEALQMPMQAPLRPVEDEPGRVMAELGIIGVVLWYTFKACTVIIAFQQTRRLRSAYHRGIGMAITIFLLICWLRPVVLDPSLGAFYWFAIGIVMLLPAFEREDMSLSERSPRSGRAMQVSRTTQRRGSFAQHGYS